MAQTQPGFEAIAAEEIAARLDGAVVRSFRTVGDRSGMVLFEYAGDVGDLLELRTAEDIFALVLDVPDLAPTYGALRGLREQVQRARFDQAVTLARQIRPGRGGHGKLRFRVVARQIGEAHFRRRDAQEYVEKAILARTDYRWQLAGEGGLEFWLTILPTGPSPSAPREALLALRLSDDSLRHRAEKRAHIAASLRPAAAAALVFLTRPRPDDVFLDPMCGAGTLLIERGEAGRYRQLLGGDVREQALEAARANIGTRYQPIELREWDARRLPLEDASVSACAVNLPFGQQLGSPEENRGLYPAALRELARVLRPRSRLVALTGDTRGFERAAQRIAELQLRTTFPVIVLGRHAKVYVLQRA